MKGFDFTWRDRRPPHGGSSVTVSAENVAEAIPLAKQAILHEFQVPFARIELISVRFNITHEDLSNA